MAVLADEECVARSNRSGHGLYRYRTSPYAYDSGSLSGLAWAREVVELVEEICVEQLPTTVTERLRERRERQQAERAQADTEQRAAQSAYDKLAPRLADLDPTSREVAITAYAEQHPAGDFLVEELQTRHDELVERDASAALDAMQPEPAVAA